MFAATFKLNFLLVINRQPSKALKFNRQSLKLKKKIPSTFKATTTLKPSCKGLPSITSFCQQNYTE